LPHHRSRHRGASQAWTETSETVSPSKSFLLSIDFLGSFIIATESLLTQIHMKDLLLKGQLNILMKICEKCILRLEKNQGDSDVFTIIFEITSEPSFLKLIFLLYYLPPKNKPNQTKPPTSIYTYKIFSGYFLI
jgi:hypothetical protein